MLKKKSRFQKKKTPRFKRAKASVIPFSQAWGLAYGCQFAPDRERLLFLKLLKQYNYDRERAAIDTLQLLYNK